jgi:cytidylate kinase
MISLVQLLKEVQGAPKAIILAGAPGAGKSSIVGEIISDLGLKVLNIDVFFNKKLEDAGVSLDLKKADAEGRSEAGKAMAAAKKEYQELLQSTIGTKANIVIDGTAASFNETKKLKEDLEAAGYDVMMVYVYAGLERALSQNEDRFERSKGKDRSLMPAIVLQTWAGVTRNFEPYLNLFGQNFTAVSTSEDPFSKTDLEDIIKRYVDPFRPTDTKPKTEKEQAKSDADKKKVEDEIRQLRSKENVQKILQQTVSKEEAQNKIKQFLNS